ncbi:MAG: 1-phosphofructokinase family hexose kinase [Spirochaetota bacterium]
MEGKQILAVCLNPTFQKTLVFTSFLENEVNRADEHFEDAGGKGLNTARVLSQLGVPSVHLTHIGGPQKELYLDYNHRDSIGISCLEVPTPIRTCYTVINKRNQTVTELVEEASAVPSGTAERVLTLFEELVSRSGIVVFSGSIAPGYPDWLYPHMVRIAKQAGARVILDVRKETLLACLEYKPDIIKPNVNEFIQTFFPSAVLGEHDADENILSAVDEKMVNLQNAYGVVTILTHGSRPTRYLDDNRVQLLPVETSINVENTVGSGDAFTAGLAASLYRGQSIKEAVKKAQECGQLNAAHIRPGRIA